MREEPKIFDAVQFYCRDGRLEGGAYESLNGRVNIHGVPLRRDIKDIEGFPRYDKIHKDTQSRKAELIREFRLAALRGC